MKHIRLKNYFIKLVAALSIGLVHDIHAQPRMSLQIISECIVAPFKTLLETVYILYKYGLYQKMLWENRRRNRYAIIGIPLQLPESHSLASDPIALYEMSHHPTVLSTLLNNYVSPQRRNKVLIQYSYTCLVKPFSSIPAA